MTATTITFITSFLFIIDVEVEDCDGGGSHACPLNLAFNLDKSGKLAVLAAASTGNSDLSNLSFYNYR